MSENKEPTCNGKLMNKTRRVVYAVQKGLNQVGRKGVDEKGGRKLSSSNLVLIIWGVFCFIRWDLSGGEGVYLNVVCANVIQVFENLNLFFVC